MLPGAVDINTDPDCSRATDADMALGFSLGLDITMAHSGSTGHSDQHGPRAPTWTRVADWTLGICTAFGGY